MNTIATPFKLIAIALGLAAASVSFAAPANGALNLPSDDYGSDLILTGTPLTRQEVLAEFHRARAARQLDVHEASFIVEAAGPALSRAQVVAETREAIRIGALDRHEHGFEPTAAQNELIRLAGQRAVMSQMAMAR
jgi:hypothetical protein